MERCVLRQRPNARTSPTIYILGDTEEGEFVPKYIGRSEASRFTELQKHLEAERNWKFIFGYADSEKQAYKIHCWLYHELCDRYELDSKHPLRPQTEEGLRCPHCGHSQAPKGSSHIVPSSYAISVGWVWSNKIATAVEQEVTAWSRSG